MPLQMDNRSMLRLATQRKRLKSRLLRRPLQNRRRRPLHAEPHQLSLLNHLTTSREWAEAALHLRKPLALPHTARCHVVERLALSHSLTTTTPMARRFVRRSGIHAAITLACELNDGFPEVKHCGVQTIDAPSTSPNYARSFESSEICGSVIGPSTMPRHLQSGSTSKTHGP